MAHELWTYTYSMEAPYLLYRNPYGFKYIKEYPVYM